MMLIRQCSGIKRINLPILGCILKVQCSVSMYLPHVILSTAFWEPVHAVSKGGNYVTSVGYIKPERMYIKKEVLGLNSKKYFYSCNNGGF